jgi:GNAT superfamily N-acetyltransferase
MKIIKSSILTSEQKQSLFELWNSEYPEKIGYSEIAEFENYLAGLSNKRHYLVIDDANQIFGWAFTFDREEEEWFAIILNSEIQGKGFGKLLLKKLKKNSSVLNGWVIDHQNERKINKEPYISPIEFYTKNGFLINPSMRIENDKISAVKIRWEKE